MRGSAQLCTEGGTIRNVVAKTGTASGTLRSGSAAAFGQACHALAASAR